MKKSFVLLFGLLGLSAYGISSAGLSQEAPAHPPIPKTWTAIASYHDISRPLRDMAAIPRSLVIKHRVRLHKQPTSFKLAPGAQDLAIQGLVGLPLPVIPGVSMQGLGVGFIGVDGQPYTVTTSPADPNVSVSDQHVIQTVNQSYAIYNKSTGRLVLGPVAQQSLWEGFPSSRCGGESPLGTGGDAIVKFDKRANRWIITAQSIEQLPDTAPAERTFAQCFAISQTPDPTGPYYRFEFDFPFVVDYGKLGVWSDAYYMSFSAEEIADHESENSITPLALINTYTGIACAFERSQMLVGNTAKVVCSSAHSNSGFLPSDLDGNTPPPSGAPNYFVGFGFSSDTIGLWKFHVDWANLSQSNFQGPILLNVQKFGQLSLETNCKSQPEEYFQNCVPQKGILSKLDIGDALILYRLAYRNFGTHASLVANHTVNANGVSGIRWYEIRINQQDTPAIYQQGTYHQNDNNFRWFGSIAMDKLGNIGLGYNVSGNDLFPSIRYTGRIFTDPLNTLRSEASLIEGSGSQIRAAIGPEENGRNRWDDYTSLAIDPTDDCTFWYTAEYMKSTAPENNWSTFIGSFKFSNCR